MVGVPLKQRPIAEPACLIGCSARERVNSFDLPARADEAHPAPRLANFKPGVGILVEGLDAVRSSTANDEAQREAGYSYMNRPSGNHAGILQVLGPPHLLETGFPGLSIPEVPYSHRTVIECDDGAAILGLSVEACTRIEKERVHRLDVDAFHDEFKILEQISVSHPEIVEQMLLQRSSTTVGKAVRLLPNDYGAMLHIEVGALDVALDELG